MNSILNPKEGCQHKSGIKTENFEFKENFYPLTKMEDRFLYYINIFLAIWLYCLEGQQVPYDFRPSYYAKNPPNYFRGIVVPHLAYILGSTFRAPKKSHVLTTKGIVRTGRPYGNSQVLKLAVSGMVRQVAKMPETSLKRFDCELNTIDTAMHVKIAL